MPAIPVEIKASRICAWLLWLFFMGSSCSVLFFTLPSWQKIILIFCGFVYLYFSLQNYAWRMSKSAVVNLGLAKNDIWHLKNNRGEVLLGKICGDSLKTNFLVILNFKLIHNGKKISVPIFYDAMQAQDFRRLRASLFLNLVS